MGRSIVALFLAASLAGCAVGPDYERPQVPTPESWRAIAEGTGSLADLTWAELFQDEALRSLIRVALEENKDLRLATARVLEARAQLGVTRSEQFPQIGATGSYDTRQASQVSFPNLPEVDTSKDFWKTTLDASFEIDLWGRLRRASGQRRGPPRRRHHARG